MASVHLTRSWTLRARLVAALVLLTAALTLLVGTVSVYALDRSLTRDLEKSLDGAQQRAFDPRHDGPDDHDPCGGGGRGAPGPNQNTGTLIAQLTGTPCGSVVAETGYTTALDAARLTALAALPADGRAHRADLGDGLGDYLLLRSAGGGQVTGIPLAGVRRTISTLAGAIAVIGVLGILLAALAAMVIVRVALTPLRRVARTATRISELPLDQGHVELVERVPAADTDPRTEVGQVGAAVNRMLDHIDTALAARTASEARMRRFVGDASHELRTPLASIRGYAELTRRVGDPDAVPQEVRHALGRIESESVRMTGLVEDLLLLARLDENASGSGASVATALRREQVDLSAVALDCLGDARLLGPDHAWRLDLPDEPVTVTGDGQRLRQVVTNLLANARLHTPPGTTVTLTIRPATPAGATVEVRDNGPGIPADLLPDVFGRFTRADSSRSRAAGSTGLGLAIVASVVKAHAGQASVSSRPGETVFSVTLPA